MQSWVVEDTKKISLIQEEQEEANLRTHARVKIARASICPSDVAIFQGKLGKAPIVPSRSALGVISESKLLDLAKVIKSSIVIKLVKNEYTVFKYIGILSLL